MRARPTVAIVLLSTLAGALLPAAACEQKPYKVFAIEVQRQPLVAATASPGPAPLARSAVGPEDNAVDAGMHAAHPQLDVNQASSAQLLRVLPGISEATVAAIVAGRPYKDKRELLRRKILTAEQYAQWKDYLVVHRVPKAGARGDN